MGQPHETIILRDLSVALEEAAASEPELLRQAARRLHLSPTELSPPPQILSRALDARRRPRFVCSIALRLDAKVARRSTALGRAQLFDPPPLHRFVLRR